MTLADRMKEYEKQSSTKLLRRTPVIIRLDGKAFHTFTRGFNKPFDNDITSCMQNTMLELCKSIQGCVLGYTQSDEITLVLIDYQNTDTCAWFDNKVQKMSSVASSLATNYFNASMYAILTGVGEIIEKIWKDIKDDEKKQIVTRYNRLSSKIFQATFDARVFNIPQHEVINNLIWRQQDAVRNSIQALAHTLYSDQEMFGVNMNDMQNKMFTEKNINWNELPTHLKRGSCACKDDNGNWYIDYDIPTFTDDRNYIDNLVFINEK